MGDKPERPPARRAAGGRKCPICGKPAVESFRPFCSSRCADVDLNRWLGGVYAIPVEDSDEASAPPKPTGD